MEGFPKHMYNGKFREPVHHRGDPEPVFKVISDKYEEKAAVAKGWTDKCPAPVREQAPAAADPEGEE